MMIRFKMYSKSAKKKEKQEKQKSFLYKWKKKLHIESHWYAVKHKKKCLLNWMNKKKEITRKYKCLMHSLFVVLLDISIQFAYNKPHTSPSPKHFFVTKIPLWEERQNRMPFIFIFTLFIKYCTRLVLSPKRKVKTLRKKRYKKKTNVKYENCLLPFKLKMATIWLFIPACLSSPICVYW